MMMNNKSIDDLIAELRSRASDGDTQQCDEILMREAADALYALGLERLLADR